MTDRIRFVAIALTLALESGGLASSIQRAANDAKVSAAIASKRMPDGNQWTTDNLNVDTDGSFCYENVEVNCRQYGRLYAWESAQRACQSLGDGWRLPTNDEWRQLAKHFGGVRDDPDDGGRAAYAAFIRGGRAGFNVVFGGGRGANDGQYARLEAHGFYWTASENGSSTAWFYNLGRGGEIVNRHSDGEKQRAFSVRCVRQWRDGQQLGTTWPARREARPAESAVW